MRNVCAFQRKNKQETLLKDEIKTMNYKAKQNINDMIQVRINQRNNKGNCPLNESIKR